MNALYFGQAARPAIHFWFCLLLASGFSASGASPAEAALKNFRRGANLGNYLEAPPNHDWGAKYSEKDFANIKNEGFDHVRLPIAWHHFSGPSPDFKLDAGIFSKVD